MKNEINRLLGSLRATDCATEEYGRILSMLKDSIVVYAGIKEIFDAQITPSLGEEKVEPTPTLDSVPWEEPIHSVEGKTNMPKDAPAELDMETVRSIIAEASKKGIGIKEIITKYVPEGSPIKFSSVPASSYKALVEDINNAG